MARFLGHFAGAWLKSFTVLSALTKAMKKSKRIVDNFVCSLNMDHFIIYIAYFISPQKHHLRHLHHLHHHMHLHLHAHLQSTAYIYIYIDIILYICPYL